MTSSATEGAATTPTAHEYRHTRQTEIALRSGLRLRATQWGTAAPTCVLLHGFGEGSHVWTKFIHSLVPMFRAITIDLRGHGDSDWDAAGDYSSATHVSDIMEAVDLLELERLWLIGHSLGAEIAIHVASRLPQRVCGLAVVDYGPDVDDEFHEFSLQQFKASFRQYATAAEFAAWLEPKRPLVSRADLHVLAAGALRESPSGGFVLKCDPVLAEDYDPYSPSDSVLAGLTCPMLLIRGSMSAILSKHVAERTVRLVPDARLKVVSGAGHAVMADNPSGFLSAMMPFMWRMLASLGG